MDADGFARVSPKHKYQIAKRLQGLRHLCAMIGDSANNASVLSRANTSLKVPLTLLVVPLILKPGFFKYRTSRGVQTLWDCENIQRFSSIAVPSTPA